MQGMTQSQISFRETKKMFNSPEKQVSPHIGSLLHANAMEMQPIWQNLTKYSNSSILQVFQQSPRDQDIQRSQNISVQSFCDTETDPETHSKMNSIISRKFQVSHFRDVPELFQRKGEIVLQVPIEEIQFQQFCKQLNTKELFLCRDLVERELYGK